MLDRDFWKGRRVFLTGHTGFKGGWLAAWLHELGSDVVGYGLEPETRPSFFDRCGLAGRIRSIVGDIREGATLRRAITEAKPDVVFHLAAQAIVRRSLHDPLGTISTNVLGTANVLEAVRSVSSVRAVVVVTSDKCYQPIPAPHGFREDDPLGGDDPYSASKACAELLTHAYRKSCLSGIGVATVRAGNVIGGGDWAEDRIVPDAVRAFGTGEVLRVRNPGAVRPWQHVLDPLSGYLILAERLAGGADRWGGAWNFGPSGDSVTVAELVNRIALQWGGGRWEAIHDPRGHHETPNLSLDSGKSVHGLGWRPRLPIDEALRLTVRWYREALARSREMFDYSLSQIRDFQTRGAA